MIEEGKRVSIEYTLRLDDGTEVATNVGDEPLIYEHGAGQILPALEAELAGLSVSDTKEVQLSVEQGYGDVNPDAFREVDIERVPEEARQVGTLLVMAEDDPNQRTVRVHEVRDETVVIDFNHPLAGEALNFSVTIVAVE